MFWWVFLPRHKVSLLRLRRLAMVGMALPPPHHALEADISVSVSGRKPWDRMRRWPTCSASSIWSRRSSG
ncbi:hypothetical protein BOSEA31B_10036 [Hyphomicrobiales bacterium]|nr:hypothetical protein BOSEA31B_10036 [Hyphomicrobiales bacterium]CAH1701715.1 hypothetical protein BOSEA1005_21414 [Hyphomicrobiales bacterium]CAI0345871.1 hypothetical protein BO1005MUT1_470029 [Hyphomicrobiales bacterium]